MQDFLIQYYRVSAAAKKQKRSVLFWLSSSTMDSTSSFVAKNQKVKKNLPILPYA